MNDDNNKYWDMFIARVGQRLVQGQKEYGDKSFSREPLELLDEMQQELEDVAGWGIILWIRLEKMRQHIVKMNSSE